MRPLARWGALPALAAPLGAWALGLGEIELQSRLNQPLLAEIELVAATPEEIEALRVALAGRETFDRYGLPRPAYLSNLTFEVVTDNLGRDIIRVTSPQSVTEPFVTMLVEATWPRGRLLREYTVLLDPPLFTPTPMEEPESRVAESGRAAPSEPAGTITRPEPAPQPAPQPAPAASTTPAPATQPAATAPAEGGSYGPVREAETLWGITSRLRPAGVSTNQMMVAIFEANPQAFDGNMNLLRRGAVLEIPPRASLAGLTPAAATAEVQRQANAWQGGGQQQVSAQQQARLRLVPPEAEAAGAAAPGQTQPGGAAPAGAANEALQQEVSTLRSELEESQRLLSLRNEQLQELQARLSEAEAAADAAAMPEAAPEQPPVGADPGVELESELDSEPLFADEAAEEATGEAADAAAAQAEAPAGQAAEATAEAETAAEPAVTSPGPEATRTVTTPPEPSLVSRVLGWLTNPMLLIALGVAALVGVAAWFLRRRREDVEDVTGRWEALEAEIDDTASRETTERLRAQAARDESFVVVEQPATRRGQDRVEPRLDEEPEEEEEAPAEPAPKAAADADETLSSQTVINLDQADPIAEADFHMAYGLYDQAAELISKALEAEPGRRDLKLKLLEVFFVWGNKEAFVDAARGLRSEVGEQPDGDWDKVVIMGKQICPDDPLFESATAAAGEVDLDLEAGDSPALDFAFDEKGDVSGDGSKGAGGDIDLDLGAFGSSDDVELELESSGERSGGREDREPESEEDMLAIGERTAAGLQAAMLEDDEAERKDDASARTTPDLDESLAETQESPTIESRPSDSMEDSFDWAADTVETEQADSPTQESPTIETESAGYPTMESPTIETDGADYPTMESPTVETEGPDSPTVETPTVRTQMDGTGELPTVEQPGIGGSDAEERTAEIDLDDLGLDIKDLDDLPDGLGDLGTAEDSDSDTREQQKLGDDSELLSATGVTQVLQDDELERADTEVIEDDDATLLAQGFDDDTMTGTEVLEQPPEDSDESGDTRRVAALREKGNGQDEGEGLDLNLDDLSAALQGADTVEQPGAGFGDVFGGDGDTPVDLDIGMDVAGSDDPTGTEEVSPLDPQTMTEVGTKLDLARAYIDMGDPEGARSILEEVLDEGDAGQRREAQSLIDVLSA